MKGRAFIYSSMWRLPNNNNGHSYSFFIEIMVEKYVLEIGWALMELKIDCVWMKTHSHNQSVFELAVTVIECIARYILRIKAHSREYKPYDIQ